MNYGAVVGFGSLLYYQRFEEISQKKILGSIYPRKQVLRPKKIIFKVSNKTIYDKKESKGRRNVPVRAGAGARAVIRIYG
jgi:hypothetical protein